MDTPKKKRGIHYVSDANLSWSRVKRGAGHRYQDDKGKPLSATRVEKIKKLAIPPAWSDVKICPDDKGHIQAVGFDDKGRKQYIYHPDWIAHNQQHKFDSMVRFAEILPILRETVAADMRRHTLSKERLLATIVWLLEHTLIRIGNKTYAKENKSYGLTTLREKHVDIQGTRVTFSFTGKSGVSHVMMVSHPRIAQTLKQCSELPGYELFTYRDEDGQKKLIDSHDVNDYLKSVTGESLSAKDFRTWGGTTLAGATLYGAGDAATEQEEKQILGYMAEQVSSHLGNTVAVCKQYYIHPKVVSSYQKKALVSHFHEYHTRRKPRSGYLSADEKATWVLLKG